MGTETHKVEVVPVVLEPHPNADRLSIVRIYNFTVVVNTADWLGVDKAAYAQPDSVMPDTPEYRFLKETGNVRKEREAIDASMFSNAIEPEDYRKRRAEIEAKIDANTKNLRITVRKFRGVVSMGMLLPCPPGAELGDDVATQLGITHYEPPSMDEIEGRRRHTGDDVAPAPPLVYAPKYDVESVYKYADCFEPGEPVYVTEKLDGQNGRFVACRNEELGGDESHIMELHAGSRTEWKKKEGGSNWWRVVEQDPWMEEWCFRNIGKVLYGEVFGWVQALKYGAEQGQLFFRAFDVMDGTEFWDAERFLAEVPEAIRVPSLGIMPFDFDKLKALADGPSLIGGANHIREGIVVKPLKERRHWKLGRVMVKMVGLNYLEKSSR